MMKSRQKKSNSPLVPNLSNQMIFGLSIWRGLLPAACILGSLRDPPGTQRCTPLGCTSDPLKQVSSVLKQAVRATVDPHSDQVGSRPYAALSRSCVPSYLGAGENGPRRFSQGCWSPTSTAGRAQSCEPRARTVWRRPPLLLTGAGLRARVWSPVQLEVCAGPRAVCVLLRWPRGSQGAAWGRLVVWNHGVRCSKLCRRRGRAVTAPAGPGRCDPQRRRRPVAGGPPQPLCSELA